MTEILLFLNKLGKTLCVELETERNICEIHHLWTQSS